MTEQFINTMYSTGSYPTITPIRITSHSTTVIDNICVCIYIYIQGAICEKTRGGDNFEKHFIQEK